MKSAVIRQKFLKYFESQGHTIVPSSSLVPGNDPTLLFTTAGMVQFKDVFLGTDLRSYKRATTAQRCVRAGGKHNDLENVGYTARHHTFFEMLGNFSFGDYFKRDAIRFGWEFLTEVMALPKDRLWVTVYKDDPEAEAIWFDEMKIDPTRFTRCDMHDNFWAMGDTGPCGPCTEVFYDHGPEVAGGPPGSADADGDRYVEIWNMVFMQYNRQPDGAYQPLPKPSVDTGMGLERISAVKQGVHSNYDTDLFVDIINATRNLAPTDAPDENSLRVISDHIRAATFLMTDGVMPSNEGRGYVLRRIIRRALRHGYKLGFKEPFFYRLVSAVVDKMGEAYPEIITARSRVEENLGVEEEQFARTLHEGMRRFEAALNENTDATISGELAFRLYDTYGFPLDLMTDVARERHLHLDKEGFETYMEMQRTQSKANSQFNVNYASGIASEVETEFKGYHETSCQATVLEIYKNNEKVSELKTGEPASVVLDQTPFYGESGGQVGDMGRIETSSMCFEIQDTKKNQQVILHQGALRTGNLRVGDPVTLTIDIQRRQQIALNHSATHLLQAALKKVLGSHVEQRGSLVDAHHLRFDFTHLQAISREQLMAVENIVNEAIRINFPVVTQIMQQEDAKKSGAMALFGEKYEDTVRVVSMGDFSKELCGGTHVKTTGEIGFFKVVSESGVAQGIRRIEGVTGPAAIAWVHETEKMVMELSQVLKTNPSQLIQKASQLTAEIKQLSKENETLKSAGLKKGVSDLLSQVQYLGEIGVLAIQLPQVDIKSLRETLDHLKQTLKKAVIVLASEADEKAVFSVGVTSNLIPAFHAGDLANFVASQVGGQGGGRPEMAQAGGKDIAKVQEALQSVYGWCEKRI